MHRRDLVIRRFGALDFGIGYYEHGVWVDHADDGAARLGPSSIDVVHEWLACCEPGSREAIPLSEAVRAEPRLHVAAR
jgi:hypothetical protein